MVKPETEELFGSEQTSELAEAQPSNTMCVKSPVPVNEVNVIACEVAVATKLNHTSSSYVPHPNVGVAPTEGVAAVNVPLVVNVQVKVLFTATEIAPAQSSFAGGGVSVVKV